MTTMTYVEMRKRQAGSYPGEGSALDRDDETTMLGYEPAAGSTNGAGRPSSSMPTRGLCWRSAPTPRVT